jgi:hypothetical protein
MPVFFEHHFSPAFIVELLQVMVRDGVYNIEDGIAHYYTLNPRNADNIQIWSSLTELDQAILRHLVQPDAGPLYHKDRYHELSEDIGTKVTQGSVQASINRMRDNGLLIKVGHGAWDFENSNLKPSHKNNKEELYVTARKRVA